MCAASYSSDVLIAAAQAIRRARALYITAGAGMGVDSGLPDFRGTHGLWREYPPLAHLQLDFADMANPAWFEQDVSFAWGFYGHRLNLYRRTKPHKGFQILQRWAQCCSAGAFVFTSNVDGQFQKAGFAEDQILECHGSIHFLQDLYGRGIQAADDFTLPEVDPKELRLPLESIPRTANGAVLRPNILMFGDFGWDSSRTNAQRQQYGAWLRDVADLDEGEAVVVEMGAGKAVPTVRYASENFAERFNAPLIRVNPRDADIPSGVQQPISVPMGALEALERIHVLLQEVE